MSKDHSDIFEYQRRDNFGCLIDKRFGIVVYRYPIPTSKQELESSSTDLGNWLDWYEYISERQS